MGRPPVHIIEKNGRRGGGGGGAARKEEERKKERNGERSTRGRMNAQVKATSWPFETRASKRIMSIQVMLNYRKPRIFNFSQLLTLNEPGAGTRVMFDPNVRRKRNDLEGSGRAAGI